MKTDHEKINRVIYSETELARVESERPAGGIPIATENGFELAAYRMPNGSKFVTLFDGSAATWEAHRLANPMPKYSCQQCGWSGSDKQERNNHAKATGHLLVLNARHYSEPQAKI